MRSYKSSPAQITMTVIGYIVLSVALLSCDDSEDDKKFDDFGGASVQLKGANDEPPQGITIQLLYPDHKTAAWGFDSLGVWPSMPDGQYTVNVEILDNEFIPHYKLEVKGQFKEQVHTFYNNFNATDTVGSRKTSLYIIKEKMMFTLRRP